MILVLVLAQIVASVSAASAPQPPVSVEVQDGLLRWSSAAVEDDITHTVQFRRFEKNISHTVQFRRFEEDGWRDVAQCVRTAATVCDVSALIREAEHGCVAFSVRAQRGRLRSNATEACSVAEDRCSPRLRLSAAAGSLTVHLTRDHTLGEEYADHAQHQVCYWRQEQPDPICTKTSSTLSIPDLDPGRTYCVGVRYLYFSRPEGLPRCPVCIEVPQHQFKYTGITLGILLPVLLLGLTFAVAYVLIFHRKKVKACLKPEPEPEWLTLTPDSALVCTPQEEHYDMIDGFRQIDQD